MCPWSTPVTLMDPGAPGESRCPCWIHVTLVSSWVFGEPFYPWWILLVSLGDHSVLVEPGFSCGFKCPQWIMSLGDPKVSGGQ